MKRFHLNHAIMQILLFALVGAFDAFGHLSPHALMLAGAASAAMGLGHLIQTYQGTAAGQLAESISGPLADYIRGPVMAFIGKHLPNALETANGHFGRYLDGLLEIQRATVDALHGSPPATPPTAPAPAATGVQS